MSQQRRAKSLRWVLKNLKRTDDQRYLGGHQYYTWQAMQHYTEPEIRRAMTVIGEKTYKMNIEPAYNYAENVVSEKFKFTPNKRKPSRTRANMVAAVAQQQLRGVVPYQIVLEYCK